MAEIVREEPIRDRVITTGDNTNYTGLIVAALIIAALVILLLIWRPWHSVNRGTGGTINVSPSQTQTPSTNPSTNPNTTSPSTNTGTSGGTTTP